MFQEAVDVCRSGLGVHPAYLSARVTLGRALVELHQYEPAQQELEQVLRAAPENLAAIRGLADVLQRQGLLSEALVQYRAALTLVRHDPDLEQMIAELEGQVQPVATAGAVTSVASVVEAAAWEPILETTQHVSAPAVDEAPTHAVDAVVEQARNRALSTVAALERLLTAVHVARAQRCA
jgi:tetratricopeptide (TPR) repeat protein